MKSFPAASVFGRTGLLFETGIRPVEIGCLTFESQKALFPTEGDLPFDIFAAAFYLLSRYEEYLPHPTDEYGRFAHTACAGLEGRIPGSAACQYLAAGVAKSIIPDVSPNSSSAIRSLNSFPPMTSTPPFRIGIKDWQRNLGGSLKALAAGQWSKLRERVAVLWGREHDPFDVYEWLDSLHLYCRMRPYYFFLAAARLEGVDQEYPDHRAGVAGVDPVLRRRHHGSGFILPGKAVTRSAC